MGKQNLLHKLGDSVYNSFQRDRELKKVPKIYWLDLNDLDYKKFRDSFPKSIENSLSINFGSFIFRMIGGVFLLYVICDFMNYEFIKLNILKASILLTDIFGLIILMLIFLFVFDILNLMALRSRRKKHWLAFYKRLQKYKK